VGRIRGRLAERSARLGDADRLDGAFSAGALVMVEVLRPVGDTGLLEAHPNLAAYLARPGAVRLPRPAGRVHRLPSQPMKGRRCGHAGSANGAPGSQT
jgi:hypothetical protein